MKGLNSLLAAILLIAIVVLVSTLIMNWIVPMILTQGKIIENKTYDCSDSNIVIQDVYIDTINNIGRIAVTNTFGVDQLESAVILNTKGESSLSLNSTNLTTFPIRIEQGNIVTLELNISGIIANCTDFSKAIVSSKYTSLTFSTPPKCA